MRPAELDLSPGLCFSAFYYTCSILFYFQEGIGYLESSGKETLLVMSGLKDPEPEPPAKKTKLAKGTTMVGTAKVSDQ